jgi:dTDP-4-dehydrorhamnose reductase
MKILVTGSNGQLGSELRQLSNSFPGYDFIYTDLPELDITDVEAVDQFYKNHKPDAVINCAGYTAVDKAESDEKKAFLVNATAPEILSRASTKYGALLVHISTDYVFNGNTFRPLVETDPANPQSVYGNSKFAGEKAVLQNAGKAVIIRTSWLYSAFGNNFVKTVLKFGRERGYMNVVFDQVGTPTYAHDLAKTILVILPEILPVTGVEIFHFSNEGVTSWYDFAKAIVEISNIDCKINAIRTEEYPLPAARPFYSVMDKTKLKKQFNIEIPYWHDSLKHCISRLQEKAF